ncbi:MAG: hypothetical protein ABFS56_31795 [Pseudomonadota bacterium]
MSAEIETWLNEAYGGLNKLFEELQNGGLLSNSPGNAIQQTVDWIKAHHQMAEQRSLFKLDAFRLAENRSARTLLESGLSYLLAVPRRQMIDAPGLK